MQTLWDLRGQHGTLWEAPGTNLDDVLAQIGIPGTLPPPILSQDSQDMRRRVAACYVIVDQATDAIAGYYTLSAADLPLTELPPDLTKRLPRYPTLPAARLGRLAVDQRYLGQKLGALLLADAVIWAAASGAAVQAMIVAAKDEGAEAFYQHHGFVAYASVSGKLMAPLGRLLER